MTKKADKIEAILKVIFKDKNEFDFSYKDPEGESPDINLKISRTDAKIALEDINDEDIDTYHTKVTEDNEIEFVSCIIIASYQFNSKVLELGLENGEKEILDDDDDLSEEEGVRYEQDEGELLEGFMKFFQDGESENIKTVMEPVVRKEEEE